MSDNFSLHSPATAPDVYGVRYVDIEFDASDPTAYGHDKDYVQYSCAYIGKLLRPSRNVQVGWELGVDDRSQVYRAESGSQLGRRRSSGRTMTFAMGHVGRDEAFERVLTDICSDGGLLNRGFVWAEPSHRRFFYNQAFVGTITTLPRAAMANVEWPAAVGWRIDETN